MNNRAEYGLFLVIISITIPTYAKPFNSQQAEYEFFSKGSFFDKIRNKDGIVDYDYFMDERLVRKTALFKFVMKKNWVNNTLIEDPTPKNVVSYELKNDPIENIKFRVFQYNGQISRIHLRKHPLRNVVFGLIDEVYLEGSKSNQSVIESNKLRVVYMANILPKDENDNFI